MYGCVIGRRILSEKTERLLAASPHVMHYTPQAAMCRFPHIRRIVIQSRGHLRANGIYCVAKDGASTAHFLRGWVFALWSGLVFAGHAFLCIIIHCTRLLFVRIETLHSEVALLTPVLAPRIAHVPIHNFLRRFLTVTHHQYRVIHYCRLASSDHSAFVCIQTVTNYSTNQGTNCHQMLHHFFSIVLRKPLESRDADCWPKGVFLWGFPVLQETRCLDFANTCR